LRIIFAGTPEIAVPTLEALIASQHTIVQILTQPDRPAGRGQKLVASPVKLCAEQHHLLVYQPLNFKDPTVIKFLQTLEADLMVVLAYGLILPLEVLQLPRLGCVNLHVSLLPRWRGSAPIQRAIIAGDTLTGVSLMQIDPGMDTGPVLEYATEAIMPNDTTALLQQRLSVLSAKLLIDNLDNIAAQRLTPQVQDSNDAMYAAKIHKEDADINWELSALQINRLVRAFNPWPVAYTHLAGERLRIWEVDVINELTDAPPGMIIGVAKTGIDIACGAGIARIKSLQWSGGKVISAQTALTDHQHPFVIGSIFTMPAQ
jgi:methionyl-tRNA formyltransferase